METVDWASLRHMYGSAANMPETFLGLRSSDEAERERAKQYLWDAIYHQGDFESASPHVVRELISLATEKDVVERSWILDFVAAVIGIVRIYTEFGGDWERGDGGDEHYDYGMETYRVGVSSLDTFLTFAQGPQAATRAAAIRALRMFTTESERLVSFLDGRYDESEQVRATILFIRNLMTEDTSALWAAHADDPSLLVRSVAAAVLAEDEGPNPELAETLRAAIRDPEMPVRISRVEVQDEEEGLWLGLNIGSYLNRVAPNDPLAQTEFDTEEPPADLSGLTTDDYPEVGAAWHNLSLVERAAGNTSAALAAADRAVTLSPDEAPYHANRAALRQSVADARTAVDRDPAILATLEGDPDLAALRETPEWASVREIAG